MLLKDSVRILVARVNELEMLVPQSPPTFVHPKPQSRSKLRKEKQGMNRFLGSLGVDLSKPSRAESGGLVAGAEGGSGAGSRCGMRPGVPASASAGARAEHSQVAALHGTYNSSCLNHVRSDASFSVSRLGTASDSDIEFDMLASLPFDDDQVSSDC